MFYTLPLKLNKSDETGLPTSCKTDVDIYSLSRYMYHSIRAEYKSNVQTNYIILIIINAD